MEDTTTKEKSERPGKQLGLRVPEEILTAIEEVIVPFYRAPSMNHAMKLLVEDAVEMISKGSWGKQSTLRTLNEPTLTVVEE